MTITLTYSDLFDQLMHMIHLDRLIKSAEAGDLFAFLATDWASFTTGQNVLINGRGYPVIDGGKSHYLSCAGACVKNLLRQRRAKLRSC